MWQLFLSAWTYFRRRYASTSRLTYLRLVGFLCRRNVFVIFVIRNGSKLHISHHQPEFFFFLLMVMFGGHHFCYFDVPGSSTATCRWGPVNVLTAQWRRDRGSCECLGTTSPVVAAPKAVTTRRELKNLNHWQKGMRDACLPPVLILSAYKVKFE
jgi:hypothetical protein